MDLLKKYIDYAAMESKVLRDLVSSDISKTSDPSPPTPNKIKFWANWVEMSAFLATTLLGGVGEWGDDGWTQSQSKHCHKEQSPTQKLLGRAFSHSPKFFCPPSIILVVVLIRIKLEVGRNSGAPNKKFWKTVLKTTTKHEWSFLKPL